MGLQCHNSHDLKIHPIIGRFEEPEREGYDVEACHLGLDHRWITCKGK